MSPDDKNNKGIGALAAQIAGVMGKTLENSSGREEEITDSFLAGGGGGSRSTTQANLQNTATTQFSSADGTDPITEAIRREILEKQRDLLRATISASHPELVSQIAKDEQDKQDLKFREFLAKAENEELVKEALKANKPALEKLEIEGYKTVLSNPAHNFLTMKWDTPPSVASAGDIIAQIIKNDNGEEICTIQETAKNVPIQIQKEDGTNVTVAKHRIIDFPVKLDGADGRMHFAMNAYDEVGRPSREATFTAHYEEPIGGGKPTLKEISHPVPIKFSSNEPDAIAYVERAGKIYTLPVTREKYEAMQQEVMQNLGKEQGIARGQTQQQEATIEAQTQTQAPAPAREEAQNQAYPGIVSPNGPIELNANTQTPAPATPATPTPSPVVPQPAQPVQQSVPNPALNLDDLLQQLNDNLQNGLNTQAIKNTVDSVLNDPNSSIDDKKNGVTIVTEAVLNNENLTQPDKIEAVKEIADSVVKNLNITELDKADMLVNIADTVIKNKNLDAEGKDQAVQAVVDQALTLSPDGAKKTLDGITDSIAKSDLTPEEKGKMLEKIVEKILADSMDNDLKENILKSILDKGAQAGALDEEQKRKIEENLDKLKSQEVQQAKQTLANDGISADEKRKSVKDLTKGVLDSEKSIEDKSKIIGGITREVASSILPLEDKKDIVRDTATLVAEHPKVDGEGKEQIVAAMSQGVAESSATKEDKIELTKTIGEGISQSQAQDIDKAVMVEAISTGIKNSSASVDLKEQLNAAAQEAATALAKLLEAAKTTEINIEVVAKQESSNKETSRLDKFNNSENREQFLKDELNNSSYTREEKAELLQELVVKNSNLNQLDKEDLVKKVLVDQTVENGIILRNALEDIAPSINNINKEQDSVIPQKQQEQVPTASEPESRTVNTEQQASHEMQQTIEAPKAEIEKQQDPSVVQSIKDKAIDMANRIKNTLSASGNFDRPDFNEQKEGIVNKYTELQTFEDKKAFIDNFGKENGLSKSQEIATIDSMLQAEAERGGAFKDNNKAVGLEVQAEEKKYQSFGENNDIEKLQNVQKVEIVNTKGNLEIMKMLNEKKAELSKPAVQKNPPGQGRV